MDLLRLWMIEPVTQGPQEQKRIVENCKRK